MHEEVHRNVPSPWHIELQSWLRVTPDPPTDYRQIYSPHHILGVSEINRLFHVEAPFLLRRERCEPGFIVEVCWQAIDCLCCLVHLLGLYAISDPLPSRCSAVSCEAVIKVDVVHNPKPIRNLP